MANIVLNDSLGRIAELFQDGEDIHIALLSAKDSDALLKDGYGAGNPTFLDDLLLAAGNTDQVTGGWTRKDILNASVTITIDDTADSVRVEFPDQTWTGPTGGNDTVSLIVCTDGASTDATREVLTVHDFAVTADGNDVTADVVPANGFWSSS